MSARLRTGGLLILALGLFVPAAAGSVDGSAGSSTRAAHDAVSTVWDSIMTPNTRDMGGPYRATKPPSGPLATASKVNIVNTDLPPISVQFSYNLVGGRPPTYRGAKVQLLQTFVFPFYSASEHGPFGGCSYCPGSGRFSNARVKRTHYSPHTVVEDVHGGKVFLGKRTRNTWVVTSPVAVGRFVVDALKPGPPPTYFKLASGCTPASLDFNLVQNQVLRNWRTLPRVPCRVSQPRGSISVNTPLEFSSTLGLPASIDVNAVGPEYFIAFFQGPQFRACLPDALLESTRPHVIALRPLRVQGRKRITFTTPPTTTPGSICSYLQQGGTVKVANGLVIPYGRVATSKIWFFLGGDRVSITGATTASPNAKALNVFSGHASVSEYLWIFTSTTPCASTAEAEYGPSYGVFDTKVSGNFSQSLTSVPLPTSSYACAYLQLGGAPTSKGLPTGPTLATASQFITVS